jgi:hypothetical protein
LLIEKTKNATIMKSENIMLSWIVRPICNVEIRSDVKIWLEKNKNVEKNVGENTA